ncbi:MAG: glycosyl transferase, partial [Atribacterota bacterium]
MKEKRLGEILIEKGLITQKQLEEALAIQKESKALLGEILVSHGFLSPFKLYQALAEKEDLMYLGEELSRLIQMVDPNVLPLFASSDLVRFKFFPLRYENHSLEIVTPSPQSTALQTFLREKFPQIECKASLVTPYELDQLIYTFFRQEFLQEATTGLFFRSP